MRRVNTWTVYFVLLFFSPSLSFAGRRLGFLALLEFGFPEYLDHYWGPWAMPMAHSRKVGGQLLAAMPYALRLADAQPEADAMGP